MPADRIVITESGISVLAHVALRTWTCLPRWRSLHARAVTGRRIGPAVRLRRAPAEPEAVVLGGYRYQSRARRSAGLGQLVAETGTPSFLRNMSSGQNLVKPLGNRSAPTRRKPEPGTACPCRPGPWCGRGSVGHDEAGDDANVSIDGTRVLL